MGSRPRAEIIVVSSDEEDVKIPKKKTFAKTEPSENDDCLILDGDPDKPVQVVNHTRNGNGNQSDDEVLIVAEKGQVACRDYPHPRHLCVTFPFDTNPHEKYCSLCHCYVCDALAPCAFWGTGTSECDHCHSTDKKEIWRLARSILKSSKQVKSVRFPKSNIPERNLVAPSSLEPELTTLTRYSSTFQDQVQEDRATGVVKWFNSVRGYGFIIPDNGGTDLFFHYTSIKSTGFQSLTDGEKVKYKLVIGDSGRYEAVDVSRLSGSFIQETTGSDSRWESSTFQDQLVVQEDKATGVVKWFNSMRGFGFIIPDSGGTDLFFHYSSIKSIGFQSLSDGEKVKYQLVIGDSGRYEAIDVSSLSGSFIQETTGSDSSWDSSTFHDQLVVQEDRETGVVKWFNSMRGFGFIIPDSGGTDLFFHYSSIKSKGLQSLTDGEKVKYQLVIGRCGRHEAVDVSSLGGSFIQETTGSDSSCESSTFEDQLVVHEDTATGVVKWFNIRRGYGFIIPDSGGTDLFFRYSSIKSMDFQSLTDGEKVKYQLVIGACGRYEAVGVSSLGGSFIQESIGSDSSYESSTFQDQLVVQEDRATGVVKWFSNKKGYGFIIPDSGGMDLFFHHSSIKSKGFQSLTDGGKVRYLLVIGDSGRYEAVDVSGLSGSSIQKTTGSDSSWESSTSFQDQLVVQEDRATGVVKWFNSMRGYGFIIPDSGGTDLFFHYSSIKSKGFQSLTDGEKVEYQLVNVDCGRYEAVDVSSPGGSFI